MKLLKKYRNPNKAMKADAAENELRLLLDNVGRLRSLVTSAGNASATRLASELARLCGVLKSGPVAGDNSDIILHQAIQVFKTMKSKAYRKILLEDAISAQFGRNFDEAINAFRTSLINYIRARGWKNTKFKVDAFRAAKCKKALEAAAGLSALINDCYSEIADLANSNNKEEQAFGEVMFQTIQNALRQANIAVLGLKKQYEAFHNKVNK